MKKRIYFVLIVVFWLGVLFYSVNLFRSSPEPLLQEEKIIVVNSSGLRLALKPMIILRLDDFQDGRLGKTAANLTDYANEHGFPVVAAVIPDRLSKGSEVHTYLLNKAKFGLVEIAQHGFDHGKDEFLAYNQSTAEEKVLQGIEKMRALFGRTPRVFIPPYNAYSKKTLELVKNNGFLVFSGKEKEFKNYASMTIIGPATKARDYDENDSSYLVSTSQMLQECKKSLELTNVCVVMFHPQEYMTEDRTAIDTVRYAEYIKLLEGLKALNATPTTFLGLLTNQ